MCVHFYNVFNMSYHLQSLLSFIFTCFCCFREVYCNRWPRTIDGNYPFWLIQPYIRCLVVALSNKPNKYKHDTHFLYLHVAMVEKPTNYISYCVFHSRKLTMLTNIPQFLAVKTIYIVLRTVSWECHLDSGWKLHNSRLRALYSCY